MSEQTIVFDLDGTLVDASDRLYRLFQDLVPMSNLTKIEYWNVKRRGARHRDILQSSFPEIDITDFGNRWMSLIETEAYLDLDRAYDSVFEVIAELKKGNRIVLLTARQSKPALLQELEKLGMTECFDDIYITEGNRSKEKQLSKIISSCSSDLCNVFFISDAIEDIRLGNRLGVKTVGATYGFTGSDIVRKSCPHAVVENPLEILDAVK